MTAASLDIVAIGNAIVDVIATAEEDFLVAEGLAKGSMQLISADRAGDLYSKMGPGREISGGSAANTIAGMAALGRKCGFIGQVANDQRGKVFSHDIRAIDVAVTTPARESEPALVGGHFDTQFTFAQALTEAAAAVPNVVVLVSIPASDIAVGGDRGQDALARLRNVVRRKSAQWKPAEDDESFEIVRRRLFEPLIAPEQYTARDVTARAFYELYRTQAAEFPPETREAAYCLLYTSPSPRDRTRPRMPSSA